jgi:hypothetical protein
LTRDMTILGALLQHGNSCVNTLHRYLPQYPKGHIIASLQQLGDMGYVTHHPVTKERLVGGTSRVYIATDMGRTQYTGWMLQSQERWRG